MLICIRIESLPGITLGVCSLSLKWRTGTMMMTRPTCSLRQIRISLSKITTNCTYGLAIHSIREARSASGDEMGESVDRQAEREPILQGSSGAVISWLTLE